MVLGSGLGAFADELTDRTEIPYAEIPGWPQSTAVGHAGKLVIGKPGRDRRGGDGRPRALYEGYTAAQVTHGVRVLRAIGVRSLVFTNAAGGINLALQRGGLVLISDHINLHGREPAGRAQRRRARARASPTCPRPTRREYREIAQAVAAELVHSAHGRRLRGDARTQLRDARRDPLSCARIGADVVGMSTVPEVIVANHMGMKVLGISCVTNMAAGILPQKINHEEVLETGAMVRDTLVQFLKALLPRLGGGVT